MALPPARSVERLRSIPDVLALLGIPDAPWEAFIHVVGDPGNSLHSVAALPSFVVVQGTAGAILADGSGLSAMQSAQVGLVWRTARFAGFLHNEGNPQDFVDVDPWEPQLNVSLANTTSRTPSSTRQSSGVKEKVLKMANIIDQGDDCELVPPDLARVQQWHQRYIATMGAPPVEEEEASDAQLAGLYKRVMEMNMAPYVDFGIFQPFSRRAMRSSEFRTYIPLGDGSFLMKELPGPQNYAQWLTCWRVFKVAAISLGITSVAALLLYERTIEKLVQQWPKAWGLVAMADDKARAERLEKLRRNLLADQMVGRATPSDWSETEPWTCCFRELALDEVFWNEQVRHPATAWLAAGARGQPQPTAEAIAEAHLPGGHETFEIPTEDKDARKRQANKDKRLAKKKKWQVEKDELAKFRSQQSGGMNKEASKGKGKGKSKDQAGQEICFSWAKNVGSCAGMGPGMDCKAKVRRVHKCQHCFSPGHQNHECTQK